MGPLHVTIAVIMLGWALGPDYAALSAAATVCFLLGFIWHLERWNDCPTENELIRGYIRVLLCLLRGQGWRPDLMDWQIQLIRRIRRGQGTDIIEPAPGYLLWKPADVLPGDVFQVSYNYNRDNYEFFFRPTPTLPVCPWPPFTKSEQDAALTLPADRRFTKALAGATDMTYMVLALAGPYGDFYRTVSAAENRPRVADLFRHTQIRGCTIELISAKNEVQTYSSDQGDEVIAWPATNFLPDNRCSTPEQLPELL